MASSVRRFQREGEGTAFERVAMFTDGVYAIALTLIVVAIGVPALTEGGNAGELWRALGDHLRELVSFLVGVGVIGFYWTSHHEAFNRLDAVDRRYASWTVLYLGGVAFLPYPIRLVGSYADNPVAWAVFAANLALVSSLEAVMFSHSWRGGQLREGWTRPAYRWNLLMSLVPVPLFVLSVPVAFLAPRLTALVWALTPLVQVAASRWKPVELRDDPDEGTSPLPPGR